jgi:hypothetical protein
VSIKKAGRKEAENGSLFRISAPKKVRIRKEELRKGG